MEAYETAEGFTGQDVADCRIALGISQEELADLLGVSQTTIQRWERGKKHPPARLQDELDDVFHDFLTDVELARESNVVKEAPWSQVVRFWRRQDALQTG